MNICLSALRAPSMRARSELDVMLDVSMAPSSVCMHESPASDREETHCRFCHSMLPDWKLVLTPPLCINHPAAPTMSVTFNGKVSPDT